MDIPEYMVLCCLLCLYPFINPKHNRFHISPCKVTAVELGIFSGAIYISVTSPRDTDICSITKRAWFLSLLCLSSSG